MSTCIVDETGDQWNVIMSDIINRSAHIVTLHGAGSFNGISVADAESVIANELIPRVSEYLKDGVVTFIFDGDNDDLLYPDIGYIMGRLCDYFGDRIDAYAVQTLGWYRYREHLPELRPLHSANGREYNTVLFPDKTFPGDHDHFSQNEQLTRAAGYEQWYVGACGLIASKQLADYSQKVAGSNSAHIAIVFRLPVSVEQEAKICQKIAAAVDAEKRHSLLEALKRRKERPYGLLFDARGDFISMPEYGNLHIEVV